MKNFIVSSVLGHHQQQQKISKQPDELRPANRMRMTGRPDLTRPRGKSCDRIGDDEWSANNNNDDGGFGQWRSIHQQQRRPEVKVYRARPAAAAEHRETAANRRPSDYSAVMIAATASPYFYTGSAPMRGIHTFAIYFRL